MLRSLLLAAALLSATAPAFADNHRHRGNDRHDNRGGRNNDRYDNRNNNWDRGHDRNWNNNWRNNNRYDRNHHRNTTSLSLGILLGTSLYVGYNRGYGYDDYRYAEPVYSNGLGLHPGQCRWDREFAYWRGRPAEVEVKRCADGYGTMYIVSGAQRLWRYR